LDILSAIKENIIMGKWWFSEHAIKNCDLRNIEIEELVISIMQGKLLEDYREDFRGHSCLILSYIKERPVHTVCGLHENGTVIITAYYPEATKWIDVNTRREKS
jgi:hypothetical protein